MLVNIIYWLLLIITMNAVHYTKKFWINDKWKQKEKNALSRDMEHIHIKSVIWQFKFNQTHVNKEFLSILLIGCEVFPESYLVINSSIGNKTVSVHQHCFSNQDILIIVKISYKQNTETTRHYLSKSSQKIGRHIIARPMRMTSDQKWLEVVSLCC